MTGYEQMAQATLGDNILAQIAATARDIVQAREDVAAAEEALKKAQNRLKTLQEETMIELMNDAGQKELTTIDGLVVSVKEMVRGQPTKENEAEAFKWLRDSGNGGIIKTKLEADLGKGDQKLVDKAVAALNKLKVPATAKQTVHWQTLGALVREKLEKGQPIPLDLLGVHKWDQAEVKPKG